MTLWTTNVQILRLELPQYRRFHSRMVTIEQGDSMATEQSLYRIMFVQEDQVYEIYSKYISEEGLCGFIEVEELVFGDKEHLVVDPSAEKLRTEFRNVKRTYIPFHQLLRIDEVVHEEGSAKIREAETKGNVHHLINYRKSPKEKA